MTTIYLSYRYRNTTPELEADYLRVMKRMVWEKLAKGQDESFIKNATDDHIDAVLKTIGIKLVFKNES